MESPREPDRPNNVIELSTRANTDSVADRDKPTIATLFRRYEDVISSRTCWTPQQRRALWSIARCRTKSMGGHLYVCPACGGEQPHYNPCLNRHCPSCQGMAQQRWIDRRQEQMLPIGHFQVVFTLPDKLRQLVYGNQRKLYDLMFKAASHTLELLAKECMGARLGITVVLHTWARDMSYHPHVHCIVTAGGLSLDGSRWVPSYSHKFLFPIKRMSAIFRAQYLKGLKKLYKANQLSLLGPCAKLRFPEHFQDLVEELFQTKWVAYAKEPFKAYEHLVGYLGRYTHRVAISNSRILSVQGDQVRIRTRGDKSVVLSGEELVRRFLLHVLPRGYHKIRHYGLYSPSGIRAYLDTARRLVPRDDSQQDETDSAEDTQSDGLGDLVAQSLDPEQDPWLCPHCGKARMTPRRQLPRLLPPGRFFRNPFEDSS